MTTRTSAWPAGIPCWADLGAPDPDRARDYYHAVLGWDYTEGRDEFGGYVSATVDGLAVAGIGGQAEGADVAWRLYLATDDAAAGAAAVTDAGGQVVLGPHQVGELGHMVLATDPSGAVFGLWQAGTHIGASLVNQPGAMTWEDLRSTDPASAQDFYRSVFGYEIRPLSMAGPDYGTFHQPGDDAPLGGMGGMMGGECGSHWVVYFAVASTDDAAAAATAAGGEVRSGPFDTPYGRMAELVDPFGASITVMQNTGQPRPDRSG